MHQNTLFRDWKFTLISPLGVYGDSIPCVPVGYLFSYQTIQGKVIRARD